jgi:hypothetical protein
MSWKSRTGLSDSQANANALATRGSPYRREHEASGKAAQPVTLAGFKREFRDAYEAELPIKLQAVEDVEPDSALGTPRWSGGFRAYIAPNGERSAFARDDEGGYRWPLRASIAWMANHPASPAERRSAEFLYLLQLDGDFDHVRTWRVMLGKRLAVLADNEFVLGTVDPFAAEALRRWWAAYNRAPRMRTVREPETCAYPTPRCPHGAAA